MTSALQESAHPHPTHTSILYIKNSRYLHSVFLYNVQAEIFTEGRAHAIGSMGDAHGNLVLKIIGHAERMIESKLGGDR
jgi:hypothetical protein